MNAKKTTGNLYIISGIANGREVFLGKAIDEPFQDQISIEGKPIACTPQGMLTVRPFHTIINCPIRDPGYSIQMINNPEAIAEATAILDVGITQLQRATYPLLHRWIESCLRFDAPAAPWGATGWARNGYGAANPFQAFFEGFLSSATTFRRALFQSTQVSSTTELDKLTELEGSLTIDAGKVTNQIAIKFNQTTSREPELAKYLEAVQIAGAPVPSAGQLAGWTFLMNRLQVAKNWAQRHGKTPLVRDVNELTKQGINGLNELILEHCAALDTMITETFSQYGIIYEVHPACSPFTSYTAPFAGTVEEMHGAVPIGAGIGSGIPSGI